MAKWHDTRSTQGELLYSVRECGKYSVWYEHGQWVAFHHPEGAFFGKRTVIGRDPSFSPARMICRDHIQSVMNGEVAL